MERVPVLYQAAVMLWAASFGFALSGFLFRDWAVTGVGIGFGYASVVVGGLALWRMFSSRDAAT